MERKPSSGLPAVKDKPPAPPANSPDAIRRTMEAVIQEQSKQRRSTEPSLSKAVKKTGT
jgi:hypothetical protein